MIMFSSSTVVSGSAISAARVDTGAVDELHRGGSSAIAVTGQRTMLVTVDCLAIQDLTVLHLDVERHELEVLKGAAETLARCSPVILIEENRGNCSEYLHGEGYEFVGKIPEVSVWSNPFDVEKIKEAVPALES